MGFTGSAVSVLILAGAVVLVWRMALHLDFNKVPYNHKPGNCRPVEPIKDGSEDVVLLPGGHAIITSGLRYTKAEELIGVIGKLYFFDFNQNSTTKNPHADEIKINWSPDKAKVFNPHGVKSYIDKKGVIFLYVINHEPQGDAIEIFEFNPKTKSASYVKSIRNELIFNANNLAIIDKEEFFVTNDVYFHNFLKNIEFVLPMFSLGSIVYYNKGEARVADHFFMPNGMDIDKSKKHLFVANIKAKQLLIYDIDSNRKIKQSKVIEVGAMVDNVVYDEERNTIWMGCHPVTYRIVEHMAHPKTVHSPSQVITARFTDRQFSNYTLDDPYANDGSELSASTVAVRYNNQILIGTVNDKLMLCDITKY